MNDPPLESRSCPKPKSLDDDLKKWPSPNLKSANILPFFLTLRSLRPSSDGAVSRSDCSTRSTPRLFTAAAAPGVPLLRLCRIATSRRQYLSASAFSLSRVAALRLRWVVLRLRRSRGKWWKASRYFSTCCCYIFWACCFVRRTPVPARCPNLPLQFLLGHKQPRHDRCMRASFSQVLPFAAGPSRPDSVCPLSQDNFPNLALSPRS